MKYLYEAAGARDWVNVFFVRSEDAGCLREGSPLAAVSAKALTGWDEYRGLLVFHGRWREDFEVPGRERVEHCCVETAGGRILATAFL